MDIKLLSKIELLISNDNDDDNKKIASFLLEHYKNFKNVNINIIAKKCETSPTKVTRFATKLGLSGFSELKLRLIDLAESILIDGELSDVKNTIVNNGEDFFKNYQIIHKNAFEIQAKYFESKSLELILNLLKESKTVYLFAFNLSYNISKNFVQRLRWFGINIISESDYISIETFINVIKPTDLIILISISGKNPLIKKIGDLLKNKTKLIGIISDDCEFKNLFVDYLSFSVKENDLWSINSIKAQLIIQLLDFLYAKFILSIEKDRLLENKLGKLI